MSGRIFAVLLLALAAAFHAPPATAQAWYTVQATEDGQLRRLIVEVARELNGKYREWRFSNPRSLVSRLIDGRTTFLLQGERVVIRTNISRVWGWNENNIQKTVKELTFSLSNIGTLTSGWLNSKTGAVHFNCVKKWQRSGQSYRLIGTKKCVKRTDQRTDTVLGTKSSVESRDSATFRFNPYDKGYSGNADGDRIRALVRKFEALQKAKFENRQTARRQPGRQAADPPRAPRSSAAATAEAALFLSRIQRKAVQQALNDLGHNAGVPDGIFGARTRAAIRALQKALGQQPTGYLTDLLLSKLREKMRSARTETAGSIPRAGSCIRHQDVGQCDAHWSSCAHPGARSEADGSSDDYQLNVKFTNNCPHEVFLRVRHLHGLKYEVDRGAPIKCSSGGAMNIKPGESYMWIMGPLPRGVTQKWEGCVQYSNEDIQKRSGERNCYQRRRPKCPAGYK